MTIVAYQRLRLVLVAGRGAVAAVVLLLTVCVIDRNTDLLLVQCASGWLTRHWQPLLLSAGGVCRLCTSSGNADNSGQLISSPHGAKLLSEIMTRRVWEQEEAGSPKNARALEWRPHITQLAKPHTRHIYRTACVCLCFSTLSTCCSHLAILASIDSSIPFIASTQLSTHTRSGPLRRAAGPPPLLGRASPSPTSPLRPH